MFIFCVQDRVPISIGGTNTTKVTPPPPPMSIRPPLESGSNTPPSKNRKVTLKNASTATALCKSMEFPSNAIPQTPPYPPGSPPTHPPHQHSTAHTPPYQLSPLLILRTGLLTSKRRLILPWGGFPAQFGFFARGGLLLLRF